MWDHRAHVTGGPNESSRKKLPLNLKEGFRMMRHPTATTAAVTDTGKVRLGGYAPTLAPTADAGKVRLGGYAPTLAPTADAGKVRLGGYAPTLPPTR
jgi:hypothetical protein